MIACQTAVTYLSLFCEKEFWRGSLELKAFRSDRGFFVVAGNNPPTEARDESCRRSATRGILQVRRYHRRFHNCFHTWTSSWIERALGTRSFTIRQRA